MNRILSTALLLWLALPIFPSAHADEERERGVGIAPKRERVPSLPEPAPPPPVPCRPTYLDPDRCNPYPDYRLHRPVIIQQAQPDAVDDDEPSDDWEGCRKMKLKQLNASRDGDTSSANELDTWLWKNCRSYSNELRDMEDM